MLELGRVTAGWGRSTDLSRTQDRSVWPSAPKPLPPTGLGNKILDQKKNHATEELTKQGRKENYYNDNIPKILSYLIIYGVAEYLFAIFTSTENHKQ